MTWRVEAKLKNLGKQFQVRQFDFARELQPFQPDLTDPDGDQTAYGQVFEDVLREARDQRTAGLILMTDGALRALPPHDLDTLSAARKLGDSQIPIYSIGYGASQLSTGSIDIALEDLRVDPIVFEKKLVPITCKIRALGARGKKIRIRVLTEDRRDKRPTESGVLKPAISTQQAKTVREIEISQDAETIMAELSFFPNQAGEIKIALEVEPLENELLTQNNHRETILTVKKGGVNVAYFDQVRPENSRINMVNGADKIQLQFQEVRTGKFAAQTKFDPTWFQKGRFDVYIIGDVRAEWFGAENLRQLEARLEDGAGLMMTGGRQNFSAGGYAESPLVNWLPVQMESSDFVPPGQLNLKTRLNGEVKVVPTAAGLSAYVMQLGSSDQNRSLWAELPALAGATRLKQRDDLVRVWAESPDHNPLLLVSEVGRSRIAAFAADTTWLWCLGNKQESHQRFWRQMILWLARKDADQDQPIWVSVEPRNYIPGATAILNFGVRPVTPDGNVDFQVEVTKPDGTVEKPTPRQSAGTYSAEFTKTSEPGDYWVRVLARKGGQLLPEIATTRFIVDSRDLELDYPSADYEFLKEISSLSGGRSLKSEELPDFLDQLKQRKFNDTARLQLITLWDNWWLLIAFVGLMTIEWIVRKKSGLV